jgi:Flp pilus assembly pilin Flp
MSVCALNSRLRRIGRGRTGAIIVEYLFLIMFIVLVALIGIKTFGNTLNNKMGSNNNSVTNAWQ